MRDRNKDICSLELPISIWQVVSSIPSWYFINPIEVYAWKNEGHKYDGVDEVKYMTMNQNLAANYLSLAIRKPLSEVLIWRMELVSVPRKSL